MLTAIKSLFRDRRDRQEFLKLRATMVGIHTLLFPQNEMTGQLDGWVCVSCGRACPSKTACEEAS